MRIAIVGIITIALGALIALIAIILYKRHLNRVVAGEEHDLHRKTAEPHTVIRSVLICIMGIWLLISMANIASLKAEVQNMSRQMNNQYNWLSDEIHELSMQLDSQDAVADDYRFGFKDIDPESRTMTMEFSARLKEYSNDSVVCVQFGNATAELTNNGGVFTGNLPVELFTLYETYPILTVETKGIIRTQELDQCPDGYLGEDLLAMLVRAGDDSSIEYDKKGNLAVSGEMTVFGDGSKIEGLSLQSASITFELDGETVKEIPLTFINGVADKVDITGSIPAEKDQPFYICLKGITNAGWTVTQRVAYYHWEEGHKVYLGGDISVTDENGNVLYEVRVDLD